MLLFIGIVLVIFFLFVAPDVMFVAIALGLAIYFWQITLALLAIWLVLYIVFKVFQALFGILNYIGRNIDSTKDNPLIVRMNLEDTPSEKRKNTEIYEGENEVNERLSKNNLIKE